MNEAVVTVRYTDIVERDAPSRAAALEAVGAVAASGSFVGGASLTAFETALARVHRVGWAVGVASGTDALMLALQAVGVGVDTEVIVPAVSFFATAGAVLALGARPVVVDVLPDSPLMDPDAARRGLGPRTRAVVPVHLYGNCARIGDFPVPVVEDGAQAIAREPVGDVMTLSFYPSKVLGAMGDGGAVLTRDQATASRVRALGLHGRTADGAFDRVDGVSGRNCRLDSVQAAWLGTMLDDVRRRVERRREIASRYDRELGCARVPRDACSPVSVYAIRHPQRTALAEALLLRGVETRVYYPRPLSAEPALRALSCRATPNADRFCSETLGLPCHVAMTDAQVSHVIESVRALA